MSNVQLETAIEASWENRDSITPATTGEVRAAIEDTLNALDSGTLRVAEPRADGKWHVNQWAKKAVLLSFRLNDMTIIEGGPGNAGWWDKVPSKFDGWGENKWRDAGFRAVPGSIVRRSVKSNDLHGSHVSFDFLVADLTLTQHARVSAGHGRFGPRRDREALVGQFCDLV